MFSRILTVSSLLLAAQASPLAVESRAPCTNLEIIFARGTTEPGTFGSYLGDPLYSATVSKFGSVATLSGYRVNYPASLACNSKALGAADTVSHIVSQAAACPQQKFALVGYSQGADLLHDATVKLKQSYPAIGPKVIAVVLFGDPGNRGPNLQSPIFGITPVIPAPYANRLKQNCNTGDPVCSFSGTNVQAHLTYATTGKFIVDSANFIFNQYQTNGNSGPSPASFGRPGADPATSPTPGNIAALTAIGQALGQTSPGTCT